MRAGLLSAVVLLAAFHAWSLKIYPPPNPDEAMEANHSYNLLTTGENVYSLFQDIFPPKFEPVSKAFPNVLRPFYNAALAGAFRLLGVSLASGRLLSLACSSLTAALACWLAWRRTGSWIAVSAVLAYLGTNPVFNASSHDVRPEALLGLFAMAAFACLDKAAAKGKAGAEVPRGSGWAFLSGLLAGASIGVHTNGGGIALAAVAACCLTAPRRLAYLVLGGFAAGAGLAWFVRPDRFLPGWIVFEGFFGYLPPYKTWGWNLSGMASGEVNRWIGARAMGHEPMTGLFAWTLALEWSLVLGIWLAGWRIVKDSSFRGLLAWIGAMTLFHGLFFTLKNPQYLSVSEPFLVLMVAEFLCRSWRGEGDVPLTGGVALAGTGAAVLALAAPFLVAPSWIVLAHPASDKKRRGVVWFLALAGLVPAFCLHTHAVGAFSSSMALGAAVFGSWLGWLVLALPPAAFLARVLFKPARAEVPLAAAAMTVCFGLLIACNGVELLDRCRSGPRFGPVEEALRRLVPAEAKVLGPQRLWLALWDRPYRDWNALAYSRWLTGSRSARPLLAGWKPDILLADEDFRRIFVKDGALVGFADAPLERIAVISFGPGFKQPIEVLRFSRGRLPTGKPKEARPRPVPGS